MTTVFESRLIGPLNSIPMFLIKNPWKAWELESNRLRFKFQHLSAPSNCELPRILFLVVTLLAHVRGGVRKTDNVCNDV